MLIKNLQIHLVQIMQNRIWLDPLGQISEVISLILQQISCRFVFAEVSLVFLLHYRCAHLMDKIEVRGRFVSKYQSLRLSDHLLPSTLKIHLKG